LFDTLNVMKTTNILLSLTFIIFNVPSRCHKRNLDTIRDRICSMSDNRLVTYEYDLSLDISLLIRGWIQDNTEGKNTPLFYLEESIEKFNTELRLVREEMLRRGLEKR
jgi:hypothetical protein